MRVLLTGSTGFVGSHVARSLLAQGADLALAIRETTLDWRIESILNQVETIAFDLTRPFDSMKAIEAFRPDAIVHSAWLGVSASLRDDPSQVDNIRSTVDLIEIARKVGARHFIGIGSQAEYGPSPTARSISETDPTRPISLYGVAKLSTGLLASRICVEAGLRFAWLRLFSAYGPMDEPGTMIPSLILKLIKREKPDLTEGKQLWDYLHIEDAANAIAKAVDEPKLKGIYNLGSGRVTTIRSVVESLRDAVDSTLPLGFGVIPYQPESIMHLQADVTKLKKALSWRPAINLQEGLNSTVMWFQANAGRYGVPIAGEIETKVPQGLMGTT